MRIWLPVLSAFALASARSGSTGRHLGLTRNAPGRRVETKPEFWLTHDKDEQYTGWSPELEGRAHESQAQAVSRIAAPPGGVLENVRSVYAEIQRDILVRA